jgi:hypothetical protein
VATAFIADDPPSGILLGIPGSPVAPNENYEVLEVPHDTPQNGLLQCMVEVVQMTPAVVRIEGWPDVPEGKIHLRVLEQPWQH